MSIHTPTTIKQDQSFTQELFRNLSIDAAFVLDWVRSEFTAPEVFDEADMIAWAEENGYTKEKVTP